MFERCARRARKDVAVRTAGLQPWVMRKKIPKRMIQAIEERGETRHSDLYRWLKHHHATLSASFARHKPSWLLVADEIAAAGIMGANGQRPSPNSVRQIWERLCRDLTAEQQRQRTGLGRVPPPKAPRDWTPPVVAKADAPAPRPSPVAPNASNPHGAARVRTPEEKLKGLLEAMGPRGN